MTDTAGYKTAKMTSQSESIQSRKRTATWSRESPSAQSTSRKPPAFVGESKPKAKHKDTKIRISCSHVQLHLYLAQSIPNISISDRARRAHPSILSHIMIQRHIHGNDEFQNSPGTHWIASSIRSSETAASNADLRLRTLLTVGSRIPAATLSRTSPLSKSRP